MIALVMDMGINALGKKLFFFFPFYIFLFINCKDVNKKQNHLKKTDSINIKISILFEDKGTSAFNTLVDQRNFSFEVNGFDQNVKQQKIISFNKPTVLEKYRLVNQKIIIKRFLVFDRDSLHFIFNKNKTTYIGNKKNEILNYLINDNEINSINNPNDIFKYTKELKNSYDNNLKKINCFPYKFSDYECISISNYLKLYYYYKIFNINFSVIDTPEEYKLLDYCYNDFLKNIILLKSLNTTINKKIIFNILRYLAFKNNQTNILNGLKFFDPKLLKSNAVNGYLLDYLVYEKNISEINKKIILKYTHDKENTNFFTDKREKLSNDILNSKIQNLNSKYINIEKALLTNNEKLILIDLWATWCLPCIKEVNLIKKLKYKYKNKIKFLSFSIDKDFNKWCQFYKNTQDKENSYRINDKNNLFIKKFNINYIPRFILLNNNYEIISDNFTRPSEASFTYSIEKYLE